MMRTLNVFRAGTLRIIIVSITAGLVALGGMANRAEAKPMLDGEWHVTLSGDISDSCTAVIVQPGELLEMTLDCPKLGVFRLSGKIVDPAAGTFELTSDSLVVTATADGTKMEGTWTAENLPSVSSGTFSGERQQSTHAPNPFPWDVDGNGTVSASDIAQVVNAFGQVSPPENTDMNDDGRVSASDVAEVITHFGEVVPVS